jgi:hypothetical protein
MITQISSRKNDIANSWPAKRSSIASPATARSLTVCAARDDTRFWGALLPRKLVFALMIFLFAFARSGFGIEPLEEIVEQKYDLDPDATLSVANTDGSIWVYGADVPAITIQAIKKAYTSERLQGIIVDVKATRNSVSIATTFPPRKNALSDRSGTVDYIIVVPQGIRITQLDLVNGELLVEGLRGGSATAHLVNGWLGGHNCFADLNLSLETGRLDVAYDWWESQTFSVKASNTRGNIRAILPSDASISLNATALEGRVANSFEEKKSGAGDVIHSVATVIGSEGEAAISLEAGRGNIRIEKMY